MSRTSRRGSRVYPSAVYEGKCHVADSNAHENKKQDKADEILRIILAGESPNVSNSRPVSHSTEATELLAFKILVTFLLFFSFLLLVFLFLFFFFFFFLLRLPLPRSTEGRNCGSSAFSRRWCISSAVGLPLLCCCCWWWWCCC
jgi:hypothetical protein